MICKTGGFVAQRRDGTRNFLAHTLDSVCRGVGIEPHLQPLSGEILQPGTANSTDKAPSSALISGQEALRLI